MTVQRTTTPARAARRQLLVDRWAEKLTQAGYDRPEHRARDLLADMDELGFTLPASIDDAPPQHVGRADPHHQAACMAEIRATLAAKRGAR